MIHIRGFSIAAYTALCFAINASATLAQYAAQVVSYNAGTTASSGFTTPSAALGSPERFTGEGVFPSAVTPFNPPFLANEIVSIGEGGQITLRLSNFAIAQNAGLPEIGVFANVGYLYSNGMADTSVGFGVNDATVEVSADGVSWSSLGNVTFDIPTNGYTDLTDPFSTTAGSVLSDFQKPFAGTANDLNGKSFAPDIINLLAGSGGGKWLDISGTGLPQVGYVRFSVPDNGNPTVSVKFELDAVSVSHAALGSSVVPEPTALISILTAILVATMRRRRS